jgi:hypothetical protein
VVIHYGVQTSSPDTAEVRQRLKRLFTIIAIVWFAAYVALRVYSLVINDPAE